MGEQRGDGTVDVPSLYAHFSEEVCFLPFKYWDFTLRFHLEKKILLLKKYLKTTGLDQGFLNLVVQKND